MSFAYMPLYTGDYLRDTRHLTPLKHGIYILALMHCWDSKGPMPLDEQECAGICNCRSADEIEAMRYILNRYFVRMDDGQYNKRMADEVVRHEHLSKKFSEAGIKSAEARRDKARSGTRSKQAKAEPTLNQGLTKAEPWSESPSPSLSLIPKQEKRNTRTASGADVSFDVLVSEGVNSQHAADWLAIRKSKRLILTVTAWDEIKREACKAGVTPAEAVRLAVISGWAGFKASWLASTDGVRGVASVDASEPAWRREQRERIEQVLGPLSAKAARERKQAQMQTVEEVTDVVPQALR